MPVAMREAGTPEGKQLVSELTAVVASFRAAADGYAEWRQKHAHMLSFSEDASVRGSFGDRLLYARGQLEMLHAKAKK